MASNPVFEIWASFRNSGASDQFLKSRVVSQEVKFNCITQHARWNVQLKARWIGIQQYRLNIALVTRLQCTPLRVGPLRVGNNHRRGPAMPSDHLWAIGNIIEVYAGVGELANIGHRGLILLGLTQRFKVDFHISPADRVKAVL